MRVEPALLSLPVGVFRLNVALKLPPETQHCPPGNVIAAETLIVSPVNKKTSEPLPVVALKYGRNRVTPSPTVKVVNPTPDEDRSLLILQPSKHQPDHDAFIA